MAQASFVEFFCEPGGDGLMNGFAREIGARWMVFDDSQKWVFHKITSKYIYINMKANAVRI